MLILCHIPVKQSAMWESKSPSYQKVPKLKRQRKLTLTRSSRPPSSESLASVTHWQKSSRHVFKNSKRHSRCRSDDWNASELAYAQHKSQSLSLCSQGYRFILKLQYTKIPWHPQPYVGSQNAVTPLTQPTKMPQSQISLPYQWRPKKKTRKPNLRSLYSIVPV